MNSCVARREGERRGDKSMRVGRLASVLAIGPVKKIISIVCMYHTQVGYSDSVHTSTQIPSYLPYSELLPCEDR